MRKLYLWLHLILGLVFALPLIALGLSGSLLVFERELHYSLNAQLFRLPAAEPPLAFNVLAERLEARHPGYLVSGYLIPVEERIAWTVNLRATAGPGALGLNVNPATGEELGPSAGANQFTNKLHQFHKSFLLGERGKIYTNSSAAALLLLALTGVILWWPRQLFTFREERAGTRTFQWHNLLGFYSSLLLVLFAVTGLFIHWDNELRDVINRWTGAKTIAPPAALAPSPGHVAAVSADELVAVARQQAPGARITVIQGLGSNKPVRITMRYPEDGTPAGRTNLYLDPRTGAVLSFESSRTAALGTRLFKLWNREIHTGDIAGWPTKIIAALASFILPLLALTGPIIWLQRLRRQRRRSEAQSETSAATS